MDGLREDRKTEDMRTGPLEEGSRGSECLMSVGLPRRHRMHLNGRTTLGIIFIAGLIFLLVPALVSGAGDEVFTLFRDDFESDDSPWWHTKGQGTANVRNGYLFLNISQTDEGSFAKLDGSRLSKYARWQYTGLEVRLRCIGDLEGMRSWGLSDFLVYGTYLGRRMPTRDLSSGYRVLLNYIQPEYTSEYWAGLQAQVTKVTGKSQCGEHLDAYFNESLSGIDMAEWHTYTILYENGERKYLVDGEVVASTPTVPIGMMGVEIQIGNECWDPSQICGRDAKHSTILGDYVTAEIKSEESLQVDYVKLFWGVETYDNISEEISNLLSRANGAIENLGKTGIGNVSSIRGVYQEAVDRWEGYHYDVSSVLENIISLPGHWDEIGASFTLAEDLINALDDENPQKSKLERTFREARTVWNSAIGSVGNQEYFDNYCRDAKNKLMEIIENLEARNTIIGGNLFDVTEENLEKITDQRKKLMDTNKFNQSKKLFDSGNYATALTYLNQIREPGPVLLLLLFLLFPAFRHLGYLPEMMN